MNPCAYTGLAALQMTRKKGLTGYYFEPCSANAELYNHFSERKERELRTLLTDNLQAEDLSMTRTMFLGRLADRFMWVS